MPHLLNDPASYYMYSSYLFKGVWVYEDLYPSFHSPVLYYCSLGYPLVLYISEIVSCMGPSFSFTLLQIQFAFYLLSARLLWLICIPYCRRSISSLVVLAFLWFLPFFNYSFLVMSESWFIFCLLATLYFFQRGVSSENKNFLILSFIFAGYTFLVRPIAGILFPLMIMILILKTPDKKKRLLSLGFAAFFIVFPLIQSGFNKIAFSTWIIREGTSWNLWNRVVTEDKFDPNTCEATNVLRKKLNDTTFVASDQHWWDIASQLSHRGMQPKEIQEYCTQVCIEGISDHPIKYITSTLNRGLWALPTVTIETCCIYPDPKQYPEFIKSYNSKHHAPLVEELNKQAFGSSIIHTTLSQAISIWDTVYLFIFKQTAFIILYVLSLVSLALYVWRYYKFKKSEPLIFLIGAAIIGMSVGAVAFEVFHSRYYLPMIALEFILIGYLAENIRRIKLH